MLKLNKNIKEGLGITLAAIIVITASPALIYALIKGADEEKTADIVINYTIFQVITLLIIFI